MTLSPSMPPGLSVRCLACRRRRQTGGHHEYMHGVIAMSGNPGTVVSQPIDNCTEARTW